MKTNFAIAALLSAAALVTTAQAAPILTLVLPGSGSVILPTTQLSLSGAANPGYVLATGYSGLFNTNVGTNAPTFAGSTQYNVTSKTDALGTLALGINNSSNDPNLIGTTEGIVLDFSNVTKALGAPSSIQFKIDEVILGGSQWMLWGYNGSTWTEVFHENLNASTGPDGYTTLTAGEASYSKYLIGLTNGCAIDITGLTINYPNTPQGTAPEPGTFVMAGFALVGLGFAAKKRAAKA